MIEPMAQVTLETRGWIFTTTGNPSADFMVSQALIASNAFQKISFGQDLEVTTYNVTVEAYDADGYSVPIRRGVKEVDGFNVQTDVNCTVIINVKL